MDCSNPAFRATLHREHSGVIVQAISLIVTTLIYIPFVKMDNRINADNIEAKEMNKTDY